MLQPKNTIERLFIQKAAKLLPIADAEIARNDYGILYYKWTSPCPEIGALWVSLCRYEIVLSWKKSHTHIARSSYPSREKITNIALKRRIVLDAIRKSAAFLRGEIAVTITYDEHGKQFSSGSCRTDQIASSLAHTRQVFGPHMTKRAWNWFGELEIPSAPLNQE
jgi:hypothetical protein